MTGAHTSAAGVQLSEEQIHASLLSAVKDKLKRRALDVSSQGQVRHVIMGHKIQLSHGWLSQTRCHSAWDHWEMVLCVCNPSSIQLVLSRFRTIHDNSILLSIHYDMLVCTDLLFCFDEIMGQTIKLFLAGSGQNSVKGAKDCHDPAIYTIYTIYSIR